MASHLHAAATATACTPVRYKQRALQRDPWSRMSGLLAPTCKSGWTMPIVWADSHVGVSFGAADPAEGREPRSIRARRLDSCQSLRSQSRLPTGTAGQAVLARVRPMAGRRIRMAPIAAVVEPRLLGDEG